MTRWPFGPHHLLEHLGTLLLELMSPITSRHWCDFEWEMLNSPFVSITLSAVDRTDRRPPPPANSLACLTCLSISCSCSSGNWRNRSVPLPRAVRPCHSLPLSTSPQVCSLIWKGRVWRSVRTASVFHRTNDSILDVTVLFSPARRQTLSCSVGGPCFFDECSRWIPIIMSNCWVCVCIIVYVCMDACS